MNITQFIKILQKNLIFLVGIPVLLAVLVWYFTRNEVKTYESKTTIYTGLASGMSLVSQEPRNVDFFGVKIVFDNFINIIESRATIEETAIKMFAHNISLKEADPQYISRAHYKELMEKTPQQIKDLVIEGDLQATFDNMMEYMSRDDTNYLYRLLNLEHPHYSVKAINGISVKRINNSDIIELKYSNDDPGITQKTLVYITDVFRRKYAELKQAQSGNVVAYFEKQVAEAARRLRESEDRLLIFNQKNNIINYYEQSKYIAAQKEELGVKIQNIRMDLVSAEAAVQELEGKLNKKEMVKLNSKTIIKLRNELSSYASREIFLTTTNKDGKNDKKIKNLKSKIHKLKEQLKYEIGKLTAVSESKEGVPIKQLLGSWLENIIKLEESKAQLSILNERKMEFEETYQQFAPLGATMKRIEREINVAEQAYLSLLHSLSLAKLKQQNIEISSESKIVDAPYFPIKAAPSKRKVLIAAAFIIGFIFTLAIIIILEYLDSTIKTPDRIAKFTGLELAGIYPKLGKYNKRINFDFVQHRMVEMITQSMKYKFENLNKRPKIINIISTQSIEGKTVVAGEIAKMLHEFGLKVLYLNYKTFINKDYDEKIENPEYDYIQYEKKPNFPEISELNELVGEDIHFQDYDYVLMEFPSIIYYQYPVKLIRNSDLNLLIVRSNRNWLTSDDKALEIVKSTNASKMMVILNGVDLDTVSVVLGEVPRKRSRIRRIIKKLVTFQFRSKYTIKK